MTACDFIQVSGVTRGRARSPQRQSDSQFLHQRRKSIKRPSSLSEKRGLPSSSQYMASTLDSEKESNGSMGPLLDRWRLVALRIFGGIRPHGRDCQAVLELAWFIE